MSAAQIGRLVPTPETPATPQRILELAFAFRKSKALLSAVELGLFAALAEGPLDAAALAARLEVHERGARDFFDALLALELLDRDACGRYCNAPDCALFLDHRQPTYIGGALEYLNARVYPGWNSLTAALRAGSPQAGPFAAGGFAAFHADASAFGRFSPGNERWKRGAGRGARREVPLEQVPVARRRRHGAGMRAGGNRARSSTPDRRRVRPARARGRFPALRRGARAVAPPHVPRRGLPVDPLPGADVLVLGRVLHDWDVPTRARLLLEGLRGAPARRRAGRVGGADRRRAAPCRHGLLSA